MSVSDFQRTGAIVREVSIANGARRLNENSWPQGEALGDGITAERTEDKTLLSPLIHVFTMKES